MVDDPLKRFLIATVSGKGKVIHEEFFADPVVAMLAFVKATQDDYSRMYGVGSYVALTDNELKFDAARIADGISTYRLNFGKTEGRRLFQRVSRDYLFQLKASSLADEINSIFGTCSTFA